MNSMLSSSSSSFLLLSFSWLLLVFPPCSSMDVYKDCSNRFSCGNITGVEYPFSGEGRPPDCGHPDLKLSCNNRSLTTMEINNVTYNVLEINQKTQILKISSDDLFDGLCSPKFSIATIDPYDDLFEYAPDSQQVTILYDCLSPSAPFIPPALPPASVHSVSHLSASASHTSTVFDRNVYSRWPVAGRASAPSPVPGRAAAPSPVFVPGRASAPGPVPPIPVPVPASAPSPVPGPASPSAVLDCPSGSTYKSAFITTESQAALPCNWTIRVGILRSYVNGDMGNLSKMEEAMRQGFAVKYKMDTGACRECTESGGSCGYNWTTNQSTCYCAGHNPSPSETKCPPPPAESSSIHDLIIGISASVVGLLIIFAVFLSIYKRGAIIFWKKENTEEFDVEAFIRNFTSFAPKRYTYSHVKKMTNSFKNVIGKGGFGCVYKGTLPDGRLVAVKVLIESKGNGEDFINEVASMGRTSHVNIVTLVGFCLERKKRALIYDFMPNGSLDKFIFNQDNGSTSRCLEWRILYEIALGVARGLEYLHRGCNTRILHFDIKPQNILLDKDFCPKISDFGLAKLWLNKESIVSMVGARGTAGYIAPEVFRRNFGGASHKSDVCSYGMLVLEMVGGRRNIDCSVSHTSEIYFPYWIYEDVELGKDLRVLGVTTEEEKEIARKMVLVSLWCIQTIPSDRPPMSKVVDMLEGNLQSVQIPPKPLLFSPARSPH